MRKRNRQILLRLSEKEMDKLNKKVAEEGVSRQEFFRKSIQRYPIIECPKLDWNELKEKVVMEGRTLNEIAHQLNAEGTIDPERYNDCIKKIREHVLTVQEMIRSEKIKIELRERMEAENEKTNQNSTDPIFGRRI